MKFSIIWAKKKSKKVNFELETATFKFDQKWCLEKVQFSPIKSSKVDFFGYRDA